MFVVVLADAASVVRNGGPGRANFGFTPLCVHVAPGEAQIQLIDELLINSE